MESSKAYRHCVVAACVNMIIYLAFQGGSLGHKAIQFVMWAIFFMVILVLTSIFFE